MTSRTSFRRFFEGRWEEAVRRQRAAEALVPALRLPDGEVVAAEKGEASHADIYDRLLRAYHPNLTRKGDPDVEDGFIGQHGRFMTREEASQLLGFTADTFEKALV